METLTKTLGKQPIVYVTRDLERAMGLSLTTKGYFIITNDTPYARGAARGTANVLLITGTKLLDTRELLTHLKTKKLLATLKNFNLLVFKNTLQIEKLCSENGWALLNPPAELASEVEEKISQLSWLGPLKKYLPPQRIVKGKDLKWDGAQFIVQFNRAHTGQGTMLINSEKQITELNTAFPERELRVTQFVEGAVFTNNNVVWGKTVLCGNISLQITGLKPFTTLPFATIGNDWSLAQKMLNEKQTKEIKTIATEIGKKLAAQGWRGLFGIDVIVEKETGKVYLLEINARQPASTSYESQLQKNGTTTFEAHLAALLKLPYQKQTLKSITDGAQIIVRVPKSGADNTKQKALAKLATKLGFAAISYANTEPREDWLRLQNTRGIMKSPTEFNELGKNLVSILQKIL